MNQFLVLCIFVVYEKYLLLCNVYVRIVCPVCAGAKQEI
jgi:hypothetical protein